MCEEYLTVDELNARYRDRAVFYALRRLVQARPGLGDPHLLLDRASKMWRRIPSDSLAAAVDRGVNVFGAHAVTVEGVAQAWSQRKKRVKINSTERYRRKLLYEAKVEREAASPEEHAAFFADIRAQIAHESPGNFLTSTRTRARTTAEPAADFSP